MDLSELESVNSALSNYVKHFGSYLGRSERRHWCWMYLCGLMLNGERKSIEPMSRRLPGGNEQSLQQFVNQSPWAHEPLQQGLIKYAIDEGLTRSGGVLVLDDTTLPKKGKHSVGVGRQYCGALGKVANCQSVVSWQYASNASHHFPLLGELYLPQSWCDSPDRLSQAGVPDEKQGFRKKWEIALSLLDQITTLNIPYDALVFDAGYGEIRPFLHKLDARGECFVAQIPESHCFWPVDIPVTIEQPKTGRRRRYPVVTDKQQKALSASQWHKRLLKQGFQWQKVPLSLQSQTHTHAIAVRVKEAISQAYYRPGIERWLLIETGTSCHEYHLLHSQVSKLQ